MIDKEDTLSKYYKNLRLVAQRNAADFKEQVYLDYPKLKEIDSNISKTFIELTLAGYDNDKSKIDEANEKIAKLDKEKAAFMKKENLDPESFKPQYKCKKCNDTGFVDGKICDCYIEQLEILRPEPFLFSKFDINNINYSAYDSAQVADDGTNYRDFMKEEITAIKSGIDEAVEKYKLFRTRQRSTKTKDDLTGKKGLPDPLNYIFVGDELSGKTFLLNVFARYIYLYTPFSVSYIKAQDCVRTIMGKGDMSEFHEKIEQVDFLFIDDLGRENKSEFSMSVISDLIDYRLSHMKNTFIASKLSLKSIKDTYGEYVYNRIFNSYYPISLKGSVEYGE